MAWGKPGEQVGRGRGALRASCSEGRTVVGRRRALQVPSCTAPLLPPPPAHPLLYLRLRSQPVPFSFSIPTQEEEEELPEKEPEPEFGLSGALAAETNRVK